MCVHNISKQKEEIIIRCMQMSDFEKVHNMWMGIKGFSIRTIDDSKEGIERFLQRNQNLSIVAQVGDDVVGSILCGHDGRRACFYHVCVKEEYRKRGIASNMSKLALKKLKEEHISKVSLVAFTNNQLGNDFWTKEGWTKRRDIYSYDYDLNENNKCFSNPF